MLKEPEILKIREAKKKSDICIVIPTFNQYETTKSTILKLKEQTINFDIVVVDNASTDNTFEKLKSDFSDITLISSKENYGGAGGLYLGQKYAYENGYEYIILSDNDAIPIDEDLIEEIVKNSDEYFMVSPFNQAENMKQDNDIYTFHYGCYHRNIVKKIGYVDWKMFIYGDDVEYWLRLEKYGIKRKKIYKKYWHPMKYHYSVNRVYFDIRNELENGKNYLIRRKHTFNSLFLKFLYFKLYEPTKYKVMKMAIKDWANKKCDNSFINRKIENDVEYKVMTKEKFLEKFKNKNLIVTYNKRIESFFKKIGFDNYKWYSRKYFFNKNNNILLENSYIKATLFYDKVYYFVDINDNKLVYFELPKKEKLEKLLALLNAFKDLIILKGKFYASR